MVHQPTLEPNSSILEPTRPVSFGRLGWSFLRPIDDLRGGGLALEALTFVKAPEFIMALKFSPPKSSGQVLAGDRGFSDVLVGHSDHFRRTTLICGWTCSLRHRHRRPDLDGGTVDLVPRRMGANGPRNTAGDPVVPSQKVIGDAETLFCRFGMVWRGSSRTS